MEPLTRPNIYPQLKFEEGLVKIYQHQLGKPPLEMADSRASYEARKIEIETLWTTDDGRDALFPNLIKRSNISNATLNERRAATTERLAILFDSFSSVDEVAARQSTTAALVRVTLRSAFRRVAVISQQYPDLLDGEAVPFDSSAGWLPLAVPIRAEREPDVPIIGISQDHDSMPSISTLDMLTVVSLDGIKDSQARGQLADTFAQHLDHKEQVMLALLYGLDGFGVRDYHQIGHALRLPQGRVRTQVSAALRKLRLTNGLDQLSGVYQDILKSQVH